MPDVRLLEVTPRTRYHELITQGVLRDDPHQRSIIDKLQLLHDQLATYTPPSISAPEPARPSLVSRLLGDSPILFTPTQLDKLFSRHTDTDPTSSLIYPPNAPQGLYLYGDVGTGKSMLMDLFYDTLPPNVVKKRRAHFHAFMIDVHKRVHAVKAKAGHEGLVDPILPVARELADEATVLCFDEFQVRGLDLRMGCVLMRRFC